MGEKKNDIATAQQKPPTGTPDDRKSAVTMWVSLSTQVMAATLALIAVEGAFTTFVLDKRLPPFWFYFFVFLTITAFVISILNGGAGINKLTQNGYKGIWDLEPGTPYFQRQTFACLIGLILLFVSLFVSGPTKEESLQNELKALQERVRTQESQINVITPEMEQLRDVLNSSRKEIDEIRKTLETIQRNSPQSKSINQNSPAKTKSALTQ